MPTTGDRADIDSSGLARFVEVTGISLSSRTNKTAAWEIVFNHATGAVESFHVEQKGLIASVKCRMFLSIASLVRVRLHQKNLSGFFKIDQETNIDVESPPSGRLTAYFDKEHKAKLTLEVEGCAESTLVAEVRLQQALKAMEAAGGVMERLDAGTQLLRHCLAYGCAVSEINGAAKAVMGVTRELFEVIGRIPAVYMNLRKVVLDSVVGLDTLKVAKSNFSSKIVGDALDRMINLIIEAAIRFSDAYSSFKMKVSSRLPTDGYVRGVQRQLEECKNTILHAYVVEIGGKVSTIAEGVDRVEGGVNRVEGGVSRMEGSLGGVQLGVDDVQRGVEKIQDGTFMVATRLQAKEDQELLSKLFPAKNSAHYGLPGCLSGTRVLSIELILSWAANDSTLCRLFWLYGVAGSGKSSIAASIAKMLEARLAGSFFCKRDQDERRSSVRLFEAIAFYLANSRPAYRTALLHSLRRPGASVNRDLTSQFETLLEKPLMEARKEAPQEHPVLFVIDALDECEDHDRVAILLSRVVQLAPWVKFVVTSRELPGITSAFLGLGDLYQKADLFAENARDDIRTLLENEISPHGRLANYSQYIADRREAFVERSQGLFAWLNTVINFIAADEANISMVDKILEAASSSEAEAELYALYRTVIEAAASKSKTSRDVIRIVIGLVRATSMTAALTAEAMHALLPSSFTLPFRAFESILARLSAILVLSHKGITVVHTSVLDFFGDEGRCGEEHWVDPTVIQRILARGCFEIMKSGTREPSRQQKSPSGLRFNICNLRTSYLRNDQVPTLEQTILDNISPELWYSCMYWSDHFIGSRLEDESQGLGDCPSDIVKAASDFIHSLQSLLWLEVTSLCDSMLSARDALLHVDLLAEVRQYEKSTMKMAKLRTQVHLENDETRRMLMELCSFVEQFFVVLSTSTPHLYLSLTWLSTESELWKVWQPAFPSAQVLQNHIIHPSRLLLSFDLFSTEHIFALSLDGTLVVSGSGLGFICVWDVITGSLALSTRLISSTTEEKSDALMGAGSASKPIKEAVPLPVCAIAYSECSILAIAGNCVYELSPDTLEVIKSTDIQNDGVRCMAISRDSACVILGLEDGSVSILDAESYAIHSTFKAHTKAVNVVALSAEGACLATGSDDRKIYLWDFELRKPVGRAFEKHTLAVSALAFSEDGSTITSAAWDGTVRTWTIETREEIGDAWRPSYPIVFLDFAQKGKRIVAALANSVSSRSVRPPPSSSARAFEDAALYRSNDTGYAWVERGSIQVWRSDVLRRENTSTSGHTDDVMSVAFSSDGKRIVSGSDDASVRVWDAETGKPIQLPEMKHSSPVNTIALSPNDTYIVSAGIDRAARMWDARTGELLRSLLGHRGPIFCCAISHDGTMIATGSFDHTIRLWDTSTGSMIGDPFLGHTDKVNAVAFSSDGKVLVSGSSDSALHFWDVHTRSIIGDPIPFGNTGNICALGIANDGSHIAAGDGYDWIFRLLDMKTREWVGSPIEGYNANIGSVVFSPHDRYIYSTAYGNTIWRWDRHTQESTTIKLRGHMNTIRSIAISRDGHRLVSGSADNTIRVWDAQTFDWETSGSLADCRLLGPEKIPERLVDGWMHTADGGLLLWVPNVHRNSVLDLSILCISNNNFDIPNRILWDKLCHGDKWTDVRKALKDQVL